MARLPNVDHGGERRVERLVAETPPVDLMLYVLSYLKAAQRNNGDIELTRTMLMDDVNKAVEAFNAEREVVSAVVAQAWQDWLTAMARVRQPSPASGQDPAHSH